jgi:hypothetical protein
LLQLAQLIQLPTHLEEPYQKAIFTLQNLFLLYSSKLQELLRISVFLVGHESYCSDYKYDVTFLNPSNLRSSLVRTCTCQNYLKDRHEVLQSPERFQVHSVELQNYLNCENAVLCVITIREAINSNEPIEQMQMDTYEADSTDYVTDIINLTANSQPLAAISVVTLLTSP